MSLLAGGRSFSHASALFLVLESAGYAGFRHTWGMMLLTVEQ
jgi:hypothetical protein